MTNILKLGSIDLIATRYQSGTGEYEWVEHDEQPSYSFAFDSGGGSGCADCSGGSGAILTADSLTYIVKPMSFTCFSANSKTAAENRDALITVLNAATAYSLKQTCSPSYTGAAVLLVRQTGDQDVPDVWTVKRYQRKRVRLDLDRTRMMLDVDLYCTEGGPVLDPDTGLTMFGGNGNPMQGGRLNTANLRVTVGAWARTGGNAARSLGMWGNKRVAVTAGEWTRTGGT